MLRRKWRSIFILFAFVTDLFAILAAGAASLALRYAIVNGGQDHPKILTDIPLYFGLVYILFGLVIGLYRAAFHSNRVQQYKLAAKSYVYSTLLILATLYIFRFDDFPRKFMFVFIALLPFFFIIGRVFLHRFNMLMQRRGFGIHRALIVGYDSGGMEIVNRFLGFPELGYEIRGFVSKNNQNGFLKPSIAMKDFAEVVGKERIDRVFIPSSALISNGYSEIVDVCRKNNVKLKVVSPEADRLLRMTHVYDIAGITLFAPDHHHGSATKKVVKRIVDILLSGMLILLFLPVYFVTALAIYFESGRPVIFKHKRTSIKGGKEFDFYKFRSMVHKADELKEDLYQFNESDGALFKMKNDPRLTRVGKFIRKLSIDELPQLFNVLKGDMSLVGPRPLPPTDFDKVEEKQEFWDAVRYRGQMKPGITGLWQISGRSDVGFREMILLDLYYVENQSLLFDLEILFETFPVVMFGRGAY